jgi:ribose 5-phosphate isomerase B
MRIAIGSDHAGYPAKEALRRHLEKAGHEVEDLGTTDEGSVDYPDYAARVVEAVTAGRAERGVLVCGTGTGMAIAANRSPGIRAVQAWSEDIARLSREHNDANVAAFAGRFQDDASIAAIADAWLAAQFEGGRHANRVLKLG